MPSGRRCRWSAAGVFLLIGTAPAQGRADDASSPALTVRVEYRAAATCPSRSEFLDSVRRYTTKWSLVDEDANRNFAIVLDRSGGSVRGTLEVTAGARKTRKVVSGTSCTTVTRGLAVMVALVIDPTASLAEQREETPERIPSPPAPEDEPASVAGEGETPGTTAPEQTAERGPPKRRSTKRARPPLRMHTNGTATRWMFELRTEVSTAITRRPMALVGAFADLQVRVFSRKDERSSIIGPSSIGLGLRQSAPRAIGVPGGSTDFLWSAASLRICPVRLRLLADRLDVAPCLEGNVGVLQAESHGIPVAQRTHRQWVDGGASVLGVWHLPGPWLATAGLALVVPLTRNRFEVVDLASLGAASAPRTELVSQAPMLGIAAGLGLGLEL